MTPKLLFSSFATVYSLTGYGRPWITSKLWFVYLIRRRQQFLKMRGLPRTSRWFFWWHSLETQVSFLRLWEAAYFVCFFFAALTIPRHLSFTSATLRRHTPSVFTLAVMSSQTFVLFLFVNVEESLLLITERFCSAASQIKVHSAASRAVHVVYHHDNKTDGNSVAHSF